MEYYPQRFWWSGSGARRVGLFVSDPTSWSIVSGGRESSIETIGFRNLESAIHSAVTEGWNYTLCLTQGSINFVFEIVIQLRSVRPGI